MSLGKRISINKHQTRMVRKKNAARRSKIIKMRTKEINLVAAAPRMLAALEYLAIRDSSQDDGVYLDRDAKTEVQLAICKALNEVYVDNDGTCV